MIDHDEIIVGLLVQYVNNGRMAITINQRRQSASISHAVH